MKRLFGLRAAALAAITTLAVLGPAGVSSAAPVPSPTPNTTTVTIHLTNANSYCAAVKNDNNHAGATIWLYKCAHAQAYHWYEFDSVQCGISGQDICSYFVDTKNFGDHSVCLGMNGARKVILQGCGKFGKSYITSELWIRNTGPEKGWRNFNWGGMGDLSVAAAKAKDPLYGSDASAGCRCWYHWTRAGTVSG